MVGEGGEWLVEAIFPETQVSGYQIMPNMMIQNNPEKYLRLQDLWPPIFSPSFHILSMLSPLWWKDHMDKQC